MPYEYTTNSESPWTTSTVVPSVYTTYNYETVVNTYPVECTDYATSSWSGVDTYPVTLTGYSTETNTIPYADVQTSDVWTSVPVESTSYYSTDSASVGTTAYESSQPIETCITSTSSICSSKYGW